jgi:hypothetical protein
MKFATYMMQQRANGTDVDVWEMQDLVDVVEEFCRQQDLEMGSMTESNEDQTPPSDSQNEENQEEGVIYEQEKRHQTFLGTPEDHLDANVDRFKSEAIGKRQKKEKTLSFFSRREQILEGNIDPNTIPEEDYAPESQIDLAGSNEEDLENADETDEALSTPKTMVTQKSENKGKEEEDEEEKDPASPGIKRLQSRAYTAQGIKLHKTELNNIKDMRVEVIGSEVVNEGWLSAKYLSLKLKVLPSNTEIDRRDKDFNSLREYFLKAYPHILVPALNDRKSTMKEDEWYVHKRKMVIDKFINK